MTPELYTAGSRRAVRRDVTAELKALRTAKPTPAKRPAVKVIDRKPPPAPETVQDPPDATVPGGRGIALAKRLRAAGITTARWVKEPHRNTYMLDVDRAEADRAVELLHSWKD